MVVPHCKPNEISEHLKIYRNTFKNQIRDQTSFRQKFEICSNLIKEIQNWKPNEIPENLKIYIEIPLKPNPRPNQFSPKIRKLLHFY